MSVQSFVFIGENKENGNGKLYDWLFRFTDTFSRVPADPVLFEIGIHGAAYRRIEVGGAEAIE
jgi:hypothetical protein